MLRDLSPWHLIGVGAALEVVGVVLPWLMILHILPSTWGWNGLAFLSGVTGLFLGYVGVTMYVRLHRPRRNPGEEPPPWMDRR